MRKLPFTASRLEAIASAHPTPFHIYDESAIRANAAAFRDAFSWNPGFREYFAVKATPNPYIVKILSGCGFGCDCSSLAELEIAARCGVVGESIMFTSNDTPAREFVRARELGAVVNLDDITHIDFLEKTCGIPELVCCRYNPGPLKSGNAIIGKPEEAKYGFTREQIFRGYAMLKEKGAKRFGIHTMVASNELDPRYFAETCEILFSLAREIEKRCGIVFSFCNIGGGVGIPYRPGQHPVDLRVLSQGVEAAYARHFSDHPPVSLYMECGRAITGPYGYLVSRVLHIKDTYRKYAGLDACMADLMRPALYGAYHEIVVPAKASQPASEIYDVTGSLCENNDKFAIARPLPRLAPGDLVVICDAGAHGHAMGFNYNGKLRSAELLLRPDGSVIQIRRAETLEDYFSTLDFSGLKTFH